MEFLQSEKYLVSIIIPFYNSHSTLLYTINSVLEQTYKNLEIIIVDDGSEHSPESLILSLNDSRIKLYRINHSNADVARNIGIDLAKGDFIAMLDSDDLWMKTHIFDCLNSLLIKNADLIYSGVYFINNISDKYSENNLCRGRELLANESIVDYLIKFGYGASTPTLFMKSFVAKSVKWDETLLDHQDYDFLVRVNERFKIAYKEKITVICKLGSGRKPDFNSYILFLIRYKKYIARNLYTNYTLRLMLYAKKEKQPNYIIDFFKKQVLTYKEHISFVRYMSLLDTPSFFKRKIFALKYIIYLVIYILKPQKTN